LESLSTSRVGFVVGRLGLIVIALAVVAVSVTVIGGVLGPSGPGTFELTGSMATPRSTDTATSLRDGRVLVAGGLTTGLRPTATAEVYTPWTGSFALQHLDEG
jgi:hypothetical protein